MSLIPQGDEEFLKQKGFDYELTQVGPEIYLILKNWPFPESYTPRTANILIRIPTGYPMAPLDMFWTSPDVKLASGTWPEASTEHQQYSGRIWQQWSRHTEWRPNVDNLRTFITSITVELRRGV